MRIPWSYLFNQQGSTLMMPNGKSEGDEPGTNPVQRCGAELLLRPTQPGGGEGLHDQAPVERGRQKLHPAARARYPGAV